MTTVNKISLFDIFRRKETTRLKVHISWFFLFIEQSFARLFTLCYYDDIGLFDSVISSGTHSFTLVVVSCLDASIKYWYQFFTPKFRTSILKIATPISKILLKSQFSNDIFSLLFFRYNENIKKNYLKMCDIVISGIAGRFPNSENVEEFKENLFKKVYLVGENTDRVKFKFAKTPSAYGMMKNIDKFDYSAFSIPSTFAKYGDPQGRFLIETVYEAIYDAGMSPESLMESNTGVYVGCFNYDSLEHWKYNKDASLVVPSVSNSAFTLSNRISYLLGCHGPSLTGELVLFLSNSPFPLSVVSIRSARVFIV